MKQYSPEDLIELLCIKSPSAFSHLYESYSPAIYGIISRRISDRQLAEDTLQETFILFWNNFDRYNSTKGRLFTWMATIARNLSIDKLRSKSFRQTQLISDYTNESVQIAASEPGTDKFDKAGLRNFVSKLKPDQRILIDLAYFNGYTQGEMADELRLPIGTIKTRLRAAILKLRVLLREPTERRPEMQIL